jgi:hypothetical protein
MECALRLSVSLNSKGSVKRYEEQHPSQQSKHYREAEELCRNREYLQLSTSALSKQADKSCQSNIVWSFLMVD